MNNDYMTTEGLAFEKGDRLVCIDPGYGNALTEGAIYTYNDTHRPASPYALIRLLDSEGHDRSGVHARRFRLADPEVFDVGDTVRVIREPYYVSWGERTTEAGVSVGDTFMVKATADSDGDYRVGDDWHAINGHCLERVVPTESEVAALGDELNDAIELAADMVNHPQHYLKHPSGVEIIDITRHHNFCIGNALKYIFRHDHKGNPVQDLEKAIKYLQFQIEDIKAAEVAA